MPVAYVKNGEIVLNVGPSATRRLTIDNNGVRFSARFSGTSQEVSVPMSAVAGVFAKETGYGFAFTVARESRGCARGSPRRLPDAETSTRRWKSDMRRRRRPRKTAARRKPRPSHLQVIK